MKKTLVALLAALVATGALAASASAGRSAWGDPFDLPNFGGIWYYLPADVQQEDEGVCDGHGGIRDMLSDPGGITEHGIPLIVHTIFCWDGHVVQVMEEGLLSFWYGPNCSCTAAPSYAPPSGPYDDTRGDQAPGADGCDWNSDYGCGYRSTL